MLIINLQRQNLYQLLPKLFYYLIYCLLFICLINNVVLAASASSQNHSSKKNTSDKIANEPPLDFELIRLGSGKRIVLIVGGIQGDEPGGFSAATLVATRYKIHSGAVWVVPNLNFPSIIKRSRGLHGDMNRKFARLDKTDPQFTAVKRIQEIIRNSNVRLVLNLHDGSGYYRETYISDLYGPSRWGQSIIIDQENLPGANFLANLGKVSQGVIHEVNKLLIKPEHKYHVRNTRTAEGDKEMEKSLSFYAVRQKKSAFGLEASKEFNVALRAYYHLCAIEAFFSHAGISYSRDFSLSPKGVEQALRQNLGITFFSGRIFLPLEDVRNNINLLPLPADAMSNFSKTKPIMAVLPCEKSTGEICIHYGNRTLTYISPEIHPVDTSLNSVDAMVDGRKQILKFGAMVNVNNDINFQLPKGYRMNAIGYDSGKDNESYMPLRYNMFNKRFSVDKRGNIFRAEVYKGNAICGIILINFKTKRK